MSTLESIKLHNFYMLKLFITANFVSPSASLRPYRSSASWTGTS